MTDATKAVIQEFISRNLRRNGVHLAIHSVGMDGMDVEANGYLNFGELGELVEAAERERCARVAEKFDWKNRGGLNLGEVGVKIRSGK